MPSTQAMIFVGLLPAVTALAGAWLGGERPRRAFWACSLAGSVIVAGYALVGGGPTGWAGPLLMLVAIGVCGLGYASGAILSRRLGGWQVVSWALVLSLPLSLVLAGSHMPVEPVVLSLPGWLALGYVSFFSMLIGFVFWYRGLACGGIAAVGQLQLLQPFFGLAIAATLLHEPVGWPLLAASLGVIACVAGAKRYA
jgi:drug/metabolite transporter (DMT)-like permease